MAGAVESVPRPRKTRSGRRAVTVAVAVAVAIAVAVAVAVAVVPRVRRSRSMCPGAADGRLKRRCAGERELCRRRLPNAMGERERDTDGEER